MESDARAEAERRYPQAQPSKSRAAQNFVAARADQPEWAIDRLIVHTDVGLSLGDRLRVLIKGRFSLRMDCFTEHEIGRSEGRSVFIAPQLRRPSQGVTYEELPASTAAEEPTE